MIRFNRSIVAGALLAGAVLMSVAPAQAQAPIEPQAAEVQPIDAQTIGNSEIASGSADLNNFMCGSLWRPVCNPGGIIV